MAGQVFAYISHRQGKADDAAFELAKAADKIFPDGAVTAIVTGAGAELEAVCNEVAAFYKDVWKFDNEALAYPNAEAIRKLLVAVLPRDAVVFIGHDTFGMDLGPGLSIKMDSTFVSDVMDFDGLDGDTLKVIRQEYSGQVSTHVNCDISAGAIINVRPGAFQADESGSAGGQVVDKSGDTGELTVGRRFLEVVEAEVFLHAGLACTGSAHASSPSPSRGTTRPSARTSGLASRSNGKVSRKRVSPSSYGCHVWMMLGAMTPITHFLKCLAIGLLVIITRKRQ